MTYIDLRVRLQTIVKENTGDRRNIQIQIINDLKNKCPHSIELIEQINENPADYRECDNKTYFNCYMYCFDLSYGDIMDRNRLVVERIPNEEYVISLINQFLSEIGPKKANNGDYIIYFDEKPVHAGRFLRSGKVVSKWGDYHIWEHAPLEVPLGYGSKVKYFQKTSKENIMIAFDQWAKI